MLEEKIKNRREKHRRFGLQYIRFYRLRMSDLSSIEYMLYLRYIMVKKTNAKQNSFFFSNN